MTAPTLSEQAAPRILISRMSAVGDCILTMPVLCALRRRFPQAFLAWVVEAGAAPLFHGHECLDELIVLKRRWFTSPTAVWRLRRQLRGLKLDVTIDPQSISKSALAAWLSGAPRRIGFAGKYGKELGPRLNNQCIENQTPHIVDRSLELLQPLGIESPAVEFKLPVNSAAQSRMAEFVHGARMDDGFAVINPGASWASKLWPADRYAQVARHLGERHDLPSVVVWAGKQEHDWARQIVMAADGYAVLAPRTNLVELAAMSRLGSLFVGSDTGPLHLAVAVGTPSIGMYGTTRPEDCGPYGPENVALQRRYHGGSSRERRRADNSAMRLIEVGEVCQVCDRILRRLAARRSQSDAA